MSEKKLRKWKMWALTILKRRRPELFFEREHAEHYAKEFGGEISQVEVRELPKRSKS